MEEAAAAATVAVYLSILLCSSLEPGKHTMDLCIAKKNINNSGSLKVEDQGPGIFRDQKI